MDARHSKLQKLIAALLGPDSRIEDRSRRQLSVLLYSFQLAMIPFAVLAILTGDLLNNVVPLLFASIAGILVVYSITKVLQYRASVVLVVSLYTTLPILIWFSVTDWQPYDIPRIMPFIILALGLGALFTDERVVLIQGLVISLIIVYTVGFVRGFPLAEYDYYLFTVALLSLMVIVFSRLINFYLREINRQAGELKKQNRDLEIYTKLLRHDLSNDLQAIINSVELSQLLLPLDAERVNESLEQSLSFGMRMQKLLHVFRLPLEQPSAHLVEDIRRIALESENTHKNLKITVSWSREAERKTITASRLLPLVWTNIFRNASQHAGKHPIVHVDISIIDNYYHIVITDNGPGILPDKKEKLFSRSDDFNQRDKGIGLYLARMIVESHGGTIELSDTSKTQFIIRLPTSSSKT